MGENTFAEVFKILYAKYILYFLYFKFKIQKKHKIEYTLD